MLLPTVGQEPVDPGHKLWIYTVYLQLTAKVTAVKGAKRFGEVQGRQYQKYLIVDE